MITIDAAELTALKSKITALEAEALQNERVIDELTRKLEQQSNSVLALRIVQLTAELSALKASHALTSETS